MDADSMTLKEVLTSVNKRIKEVRFSCYFLSSLSSDWRSSSSLLVKKGVSGFGSCLSRYGGVQSSKGGSGTR